MTAGETLLKLSDYPFSYSLIGIVLVSLGLDLSQHRVIYLGLAGGVGTLLTIIDPFGWLMKESIKLKLKNAEDRDVKLLNYEKEYAVQAINTKSIGVEIDKIVGILYFATTIVVFIIAFVISPQFVNNFVIKENNGSILCNLNCVESTGAYVLNPLGILLALVGGKRWKELFDKVGIAGMHQLAIGNEYAVTNSVENMTKAIDQNDWQTAKKWGEKIREEIKYRKGKREIVIKSAEAVYKPLSAEFTRINVVINNIPVVKTYPTFNFGAWTTIKDSLAHFMIDDPKFRERMDNFQDKARKHDELHTKNRQQISDIINKVASKIYNKTNVIGTNYFLGTKDGNNVTNLPNCIFCNIHPKNFDLNKEPYSVQIEWLENNQVQRENKGSREDIEKFNNAWDEIKKESEDDSDVRKMRELFEEIKKENIELLKISMERFELQYRV